MPTEPEQLALITGDPRRERPVEPREQREENTRAVGSAAPPREVDETLEALLNATARELNGAGGDERQTRRALVRYLRRGLEAGYDHGFLIDMLGVSGGSVLDRSTLSERRKDFVMMLLGKLSQEELDAPPEP